MNNPNESEPDIMIQYVDPAKSVPIPDGLFDCPSCGSVSWEIDIFSDTPITCMKCGYNRI